MLWIFLGLFGAGVLLLWAARIPVYVDGLAVVVDGQSQRQYVGDDLAVALLVAPDQRDRLRPGQPIFMRFQRLTEPLEQTVIAVEPGISSPATIGQRFAIANAGTVVKGPVVVAVARFTPPGDIPPTRYQGSVGEAQIQVGSRRALALAPLIGDLFPEEHTP